MLRYSVNLVAILVLASGSLSWASHERADAFDVPVVDLTVAGAHEVGPPSGENVVPAASPPPGPGIWKSSTPGASLCVQLVEGCPVIGGKVEFRVELGISESKLVGGQFSIQYNPLALAFLEILPGGTCDPTSPFTHEISVSVDEVNGVIFYAPIVDPGNPDPGTLGPATMACLTFVVLAGPESDICLFDAGYPMETFLVEYGGAKLLPDNSLDCPPSYPSPILACAEVEVLPTCDCGTHEPDCTDLDSDCTVGFCNDETGRCEAQVINEHGPCDDGIPWTTGDTCFNGICIGTESRYPSLCIEIEDECQPDTGWMEARVELGHGAEFVAGGQFLIEYNPATIRFIDAAPGHSCNASSPFTTEMFEEVNEQQGELFYAVGVDPSGSVPGSAGPTTMACLTFAYAGLFPDEICIVQGYNPRYTLLTGSDRAGVPIYNASTCPEDLPAISCDEPCIPIPAVSDWGLIILALLLLCAAKVRFTRIASDGGIADPGQR